MRKFNQIFSAILQQTMIYKENFLINFGFGIVPLIINIFLWSAIYFSNNGNSIGGYKETQMIMYFVLVFFLTSIISARQISVEVSEDIRSGSLNNYLIKPISYIKYKLIVHFSNKVTYIMVMVIPAILVLFFMREYVYFDYSNSVMFLISIIFAFIIQYFTNFSLGILVFWFEECSAVFDLWERITAFFSGAYFPLTMLPINIQKIINLLPFKYTIFLPIDIYMNNSEKQTLLMQMGIQVFWIIVLYIICKCLWKKGIKKYSGYGM